MRSVAVAVVLAGCFRGDPPPPAAPTITLAAPRPPPDYSMATGDAVGFLPGNSELVAVLDIKTLRTSPLWPRFESLLRKRADQVLAPLAAICKLDPVVSLRWISIGLRDFRTNTTGTIVMRGFDRAAFMKCLELARTGDPKTITIDRGIVTVAGTERFALTFVDAVTLVAIIGPNAGAPALRETLEAGAPLRMSPWFAALHDKVNAQNPAWFVYNGSIAGGGAFGGAQTRGMVASFDLDGGIGASIRILYDEPKDASAMAGTLQAQVGQMPNMFDELTVGQEDADVTLRIRASVAQAQTLLGLAGI